MHSNLALYSFALVFELILSAQAALYNQTILTKYGSVQGYPAFSKVPSGNLTNWKDITVWKGIPFAADTSGKNRFRAPQPPIPWNDTLSAANFGDICPSATSNTTSYIVSENCLNLNIWSAANSTEAKLPVVLWSYPAESTAADALFDGGGMADKGVVFVNYNYRTGSFGWLAHPWLSTEFNAETGHNSSGNWGMLDQFAALKWVRANIASFGGHPDHITVMGQSAGSSATYHMVNSPLTKGLIVGAIIESGVRDPHDPLVPTLAEGYNTLDVRLSQGESYVASLNVSALEELRALSMDKLVTSFMSKIPFGATLDHYAMPSTYIESLQNGPANDVPILTGNTKDESGANYGVNTTLAEYLSDLNSTYSGVWPERFLALYPANDTATASGAYNSQFTDRSKVGTWLWSNLWRTGATSPVYNYFWDHAPPGQTRGAYHESEINYVLNNLYGTDSPWTSQDYAIAATMNSYWVNFIKTGNPNGANLVPWAPATPRRATVQRVGNGFGAVPVAPRAKILLFISWFASLQAY